MTVYESEQNSRSLYCAEPIASAIPYLKRAREVGLPPVLKEITNDLPSWLRDPEEFTDIVDQEIFAYTEIVRLARSLSSARMDARIDTMAKCKDAYRKVLVFDDNIVSLA